MTAACGGGPSALRPGSGATVVASAGAITAGLELITPWLLPFAFLIDAFAYDALNSCQTDPPPMPVFNATDIANLVGGVFNPSLSATLSKVHDVLLNYFWATYCECTSGPQPPALGTLPQPPGTVLPPFNATGGVCMTDVQTITYGMLGVGCNSVSNQTNRPTLFFGFPDTTVPPRMPALLPPNPYAVQLTVDNHGEGTNPLPVGVQLSAIDSQGAPLAMQETVLYQQVLPGRSQTFTWHFVPTTTYYYAAVQVEWFDPVAVGPPCAVPPTNTATFTGRLLCQSSSTPLQPCCPPDESTSNGINTLVRMVQQLANQINVGFTHLVDATRHAGLSGTGSVHLVASCAACRVEIKNLPVTWPNNPGTPPYLFSAGFITSFVLTAPLRGWRLIYDSQTFPLEPYADQIGYTLAPGLVIDIVEQLASP